MAEQQKQQAAAQQGLMRHGSGASSDGSGEGCHGDYSKRAPLSCSSQLACRLLQGCKFNIWGLMPSTLDSHTNESVSTCQLPDSHMHCVGVQVVLPALLALHLPSGSSNSSTTLALPAAVPQYPGCERPYTWALSPHTKQHPRTCSLQLRHQLLLTCHQAVFGGLAVGRDLMHIRLQGEHLNPAAVPERVSPSQIILPRSCRKGRHPGAILHCPVTCLPIWTWLHGLVFGVPPQSHCNTLYRTVVMWCCSAGSDHS